MRITIIPLGACLLYSTLLTLLSISLYFICGTLPQIFGYKISDLYMFSVFAVASLLYIPLIIFLKKKWNINLQYPKKIKWRAISYATILVLGTISFNILIISSVKNYSELSKGVIQVIRISIPEINDVYIVKLIHAIILAPFLEELFFRGILLSYLSRYYPPLKSIILSALLFSLCHLRLVDFTELFLFGVVFGLIFYRTKSLALAIFAHALTNLIYQNKTISNVSLQSVNSMHLLVLLLCIFLAIICETYFFKYKKLQAAIPVENQNQIDK